MNNRDGYVNYVEVLLTCDPDETVVTFDAGV